MDINASTTNRLGWMVVLVLFAGSVNNYLDRAVLGVVMPQIRHDLGLSNTAYGFAVNAFLLLYMLFYILGGRLADAIGCRRAFLITITFWSLASMAHALARGFWSLCFFRAMLGVGEGPFYPAAIRGISEWFRPDNRAKAVGLLICGVSIGSLITPPVVAWITARYGWRASFVVTGASGFLLALVWLFLHRIIKMTLGTSDPAPAHRETSSDVAEESDLSPGEVLRRLKYWLILLARATTDAAWLFYIFWIPGYYQVVRGFTLAEVGSLLWIPFFFADVGALGGAWASSGLIRRGFGLDRSRKTVLVVSGLLGVVGGAAYYAASDAVSLACVSLALLGHFSWASNIHTVISEITPVRHVGVLYGITGAAGTFLGAVTQPLAGHAIDAVGYQIPFLGCSALYGLAIVLLLSSGKIERIRRAPARAEAAARPEPA
ncbi:MAG: MFS transporter [Acidobacteriota bacterium]